MIRSLFSCMVSTSGKQSCHQGGKVAIGLSLTKKDEWGEDYPSEAIIIRNNLKIIIYE